MDVSGPSLLIESTGSMIAAMEWHCVCQFTVTVHFCVINNVAYGPVITDHIPLL